MLTLELPWEKAIAALPSAGTHQLPFPVSFFSMGESFLPKHKALPHQGTWGKKKHSSPPPAQAQYRRLLST